MSPMEDPLAAASRSTSAPPPTGQAGQSPGHRAGRRLGRRWVVLILVGLLVAAGAGYSSLRVGRAIYAMSGMRRVESHAEVIRAVAAETGLDPHLLAGLMYVESRGRVDAVSHKSALGLYQLMLATAQERARLLRLPEPTREDLTSDPGLNTRLAAHYFLWLQRRFDEDLDKSLIAYNAGPGRLERWIDEAGGYAEWHAERVASGSSSVLRYVRDVKRYRGIFELRGHIVPSAEPR